MIFSPGDYFAAALTPFKEAKLRVGTALTFHMGVDPVPTVKICNPTGDQAAVLEQTIKDIGSGKIRTGSAHRPERLRRLHAGFLGLGLHLLG